MPIPTIAGTSNAAPGTTVTVSIAGQTMTTLLQGDGTWNATPTSIAAGTWAVAASVPDPAGNLGIAGQTLTIGADVVVEPGGTPGGVPVQVVTPLPLLPPAIAQAPSIDAVAGTTVICAPRQKVKGYSLSIRPKVTAPATGGVVASANGTVRIKGVRQPIRLTRAGAAVATRGSTTLSLRPMGTKTVAKAAFAKIKAAVAASETVTATIVVKIVDAAGNTREFRRTVKLA